MNANVKWTKCSGEVWCPLATVNLEHPHFANMEGIYIIWHGGAIAATVRVGQGVIKQAIAANRTDPNVQPFAQFGLFVTWVSVPAIYRDGMQAFLAGRLNPKVKDPVPSVAPTEINLPW